LKKRTSINSIPKIHKEKEMADFRKVLFALAVVALLAGFTVPASAQSATTVCSIQSATDNLVRSEGYAELVGDVVVACTGGLPTAIGQTVPSINIQVYLSQNVTSKITAITGSGTFLEALLIIDEPNSPTNPAIPLLNCGQTGTTELTLATQSGGPGVCSIVSAGPVFNSSPNTYNGSTTGGGHPNVFQGRQPLNGSSSVVFQGIPFDPPGTVTRYLRFTNIRVNANGLGVVSPNQQAPITLGIASSGSSSLQLSFQSLAVATAQKGLNSSTVSTNFAFAQCVSSFKSVITAAPTPSFLASTYGAAAPTIRFLEGFSNSWKTKNISFLANGTYSAGSSGDGYTYTQTVAGGSLIGYPTDQNQNVPGTNYYTESGFESNANFASPAPNPPLGFQNFGNSGLTTVTGNGTFSDATTGISSAGIASAGTRLALALSNIPNGVSLFVPPVIFLYRQGTTYVSPNLNNGLATGVMVLTSTATDGSGNYSPTITTLSASQNSASAGFSQPMALVPQVTNSALLVYEILFTDPFSNEYADVPVLVAYASQLSSAPPIGLPTPQQIATYATGFAPFYSTAAATQASATLPVPRFQLQGSATNLLEVVKCSCNLLFPFVTQVPNYDTGIAIANTTLDPFGTSGQFGTVTLNYYGNIGTPNPIAQCTNVANPGICPGVTAVGPGQVLTYTLYGGSQQWGLNNSGAGFQGYIIAQAQFQYCHAFAFIGGLGGGPVTGQGNGFSEGYLALVLDAPLSGSRTGVSNEVLGH
jgi:hypothetical protein